MRALDKVVQFVDEPVNLNAGETVRGYVVFEFSTAEQYPFVHDGLVAMR